MSRADPRYPTLSRAGFVMPVDHKAPPKVGADGGYYGGASSGPRFGGWKPSDYGPNIVGVISRCAMRARSRQQCRDNPIGVSAKNQYSINVVGSGLRPKLVGIDADMAKDITASWTISCNEIDADGDDNFDGLCRLAVDTTFEAGEVLGRQRLRRLTDGLNVPMQVQLLEPDHLDHQIGEISSSKIRQGIEFDSIGRKSRYHLLTEHPGEFYRIGSGRTTAVPARDIAHLYRKTRVGQIRGIPALHAALIRLYQSDIYQDAELERKKQAAQMVGFIYSQLGDLSPQDAFPDLAAGETWTDARNEFYGGINKLKSGTWNILAPGDRYDFNDPADSGGNYEPFLRAQYREIAASIGVSYEQLTGDMSGVNYSSARVRLIDIRRGFEMTQLQDVAHKFCRPIWQWWITAAVTSGRLNIPDFDKNRARYLNPIWVPDPFDQVDLLKETLTDIAEVRAGFSSRSQKQTERGHDPDELTSEQVRDNNRADDNKLIFDSDARRTSDNGVQQNMLALDAADNGTQNTQRETTQ